MSAEYIVNPNGGVIRSRDGANIPDHAGNRDWIEYLAWCQSGGVADPAPIVPEETPAEKVDREVSGSTVVLGIIKRMARIEGKTQKDILDEIKQEVTP